MAKVFLGLGSNLLDRRAKLETALQTIQALATHRRIRVSSFVESPAMLPEGAAVEWNRPFYNLVAEIDFQGTPFELLSLVKKIEVDLGRVSTERWAPRPMDIDLLHWENLTLNEPGLVLPHPGILDRAFVLNPFAELAPDLVLQGQSLLAWSRRSKKRQPRLMGVLNLTPDSFSDGGKISDRLQPILSEWDQVPVSILDLGAESTRPGARLVDPQTEWERLAPALETVQHHCSKQFLRPKISVDTRNAMTAARAIEFGCNIINDVSNLSDPAMIEVLQSSTCEFVLMHSLTVPADPHQTIRGNPVAEIKAWFETKLEMLDRAGIQKNRIILDPGVGFGKTSLQSLQILSEVESFEKFGCAVLIGHSRKSFFKDWSAIAAPDRDPETLGVSLALLTKGVDILRVHDPVLHHRSILAWSHIL